MTEFPIFKNNPNLIYLDNASSTQKPSTVIESISRFYENDYSNVHRGLYPLSERSSTLYEEARDKVAKFINAKSQEIIFTSGTTDSLNGLSRSLVESNLIPKNPVITLTELEHHANILPWQQLKPKKINYVKVNDYQIDYNELNKYAQESDLISFAHISNVTGTVIDPKKVNKGNALLILDSAQSIAHQNIDVNELDVDFMAFSSHKMYGPTGIGVLYGKQKYLEKMEPFKTGGGMILEVFKDHATWADTPTRFEAGTPPVAEAIGLGAAVDFIDSIGFEKIHKIENELKEYLLLSLSQIDNLIIHHDKSPNAGAVVSLSIEGIHGHDIAQYLGDHNICVRAGHHCTHIFHRDVLKVNSTVRVSLGVYNTKSDISIFAERLKEAIEIYRS